MSFRLIWTISTKMRTSNDDVVLDGGKWMGSHVGEGAFDSFFMEM
jgi:hypothetical protein